MILFTDYVRLSSLAVADLPFEYWVSTTLLILSSFGFAISLNRLVSSAKQLAPYLAGLGVSGLVISICRILGGKWTGDTVGLITDALLFLATALLIKIGEVRTS